MTYKEFIFTELKEEKITIQNDKFIKINEEGRVIVLTDKEQDSLKEKKETLDWLEKEGNNIIVKKTINEKNENNIKTYTYKFGSFVGIIFPDINDKKVISIYPKFFNDSSLDLCEDKIMKIKFINVLMAIDKYYKYYESKMNIVKKFNSKNKVDRLLNIHKNIKSPKHHKNSTEIIEKYENIFNYFKEYNWDFSQDYKIFDKKNSVEYIEKEEDEKYSEIIKDVQEKKFIIGRFKFEYIWEKSCCSYYDDNHYKFRMNNKYEIFENCDIYKNLNSWDIKKIISKEIIEWHTPSIKKELYYSGSLKPDIINVKKKNGRSVRWELNLYDAKYYNLHTDKPNKEDIIKQYFYEKSVEDISEKNKKIYLNENALVFPSFNKIDQKNDYCKIKYLNKKINILFLCGDEAFISFIHHQGRNFIEQAKHEIKNHYIIAYYKEDHKVKKIKKYKYKFKKIKEEEVEIKLLSKIDNSLICKFKFPIPQETKSKK